MVGSDILCHNEHLVDKLALTAIDKYLKCYCLFPTCKLVKYILILTF